MEYSGTRFFQIRHLKLKSTILSKQMTVLCINRPYYEKENLKKICVDDIF